LQGFIILKNKQQPQLGAFSQDVFELPYCVGIMRTHGVQKPESEAVLRSATPSLD